jgi:hypothetical protein
VILIHTQQKTRGYATSTLPLGTALSGPDGNPHTSAFTSLGCPLYSGGESHFVEALLPACLPHLVGWFKDVTAVGPGRYVNPPMGVVHVDPEPDENEPDWSTWQDASLGEQPPVDFGAVDPRADISQDNETREKDRGSDEDGDDKDMDELRKGLMMMN